MAKSARFLAATVVAAFLMITGTAAAATVNAHGSVEQVYATGLQAGTDVSLLDAAGKTVATRKADSLGGILFRDVKPGDGYHVRTASGDESDALTVMTDAPAPPNTDIYNQVLPSSGYGYMTMRDGTKLAIDVHPPQDVSSALPTGYLPEAPPVGATPTLIEYSGYGYA